MIRLSDRYYIDADSKNYILKEKTIVQDKESSNYGKETFKDLGYYTNLESVLNGLLKIGTRDFISRDEKHSIEDLKEHITAYKKFIESLNLKF